SPNSERRLTECGSGDYRAALVTQPNSQRPLLPRPARPAPTSVMDSGSRACGRIVVHEYFS
ncbi:hypothetical protein, partial [Nocardia brasiliensis]|uniref:hypothetical protein n=1 Tax=Nocardia brasiliensis TaxID=37326 RepID=UPI0033DC10F3